MHSYEPGSSLYYSLLWTDNEAKARFAQRLNLIQSLTRTLDDVQDPDVAHQKIHWWHEELERMIIGQARHPATLGCQNSARSARKPLANDDPHPLLEACLAILSSVSDQRFTPPATIQDRNDTLVKNFTARLALLSHALSASEHDLDMTSHPAIAAEGLAKHEQLIRLPALIHRGHPVFSDETYKLHNVTPGDLAAGIRVAANPPGNARSTSINSIPIVEDKPGKKTIIKTAIEDTHATLVKATIHPDVAGRYRQAPLLPLWLLIILRRKQLALWENKQPDLLKEHIRLTPVAKLYHAWRNRR